MQFETKVLLLRTVAKEDINEVARMYDYTKTISSNGAEKSTVIIDWCGLDSLAEKDKVIIFYIIDERYRNKGYATQAAEAILQYAFEQV